MEIKKLRIPSDNPMKWELKRQIFQSKLFFTKRFKKFGIPIPKKTRRYGPKRPKKIYCGCHCRK